MHVILYCDSKAPELVDSIPEHWKTEIPALAQSEVIQHFRLIAKQGTKRVFHCVVDKTSQLQRVLTWIIDYNEGKTDQEKIWYWVGDTAEEVYENLWTDSETFAHAIAERVLQYPVDVYNAELGANVTIFVTVYEAVNTYGASIVPSVLKQYGMPHKFFGVD